MRGTGEGHYAWDLQPQSTMTNANVEKVVTAVDGQADKSDLKGGARVFVTAAKLPDGTLQGRSWRVGREMAPPM